MKEIINRLHENRQVQLAKEILEANGYQIDKRVDESALDKFWDLYDSSPAVADALEKIADRLGISTEESPTEQEAQKILDKYAGLGNSTSAITADSVISDIMEAIEDLSFVKEVSSFGDAGVMTKNKGFVVTAKNGEEYQFSLLGSY